MSTMSTQHCLFASDLHGAEKRYAALTRAILAERPGVVFLGGDLLPPFGLRQASSLSTGDDFFDDFLAPLFRELRGELGERYPRILLILGNDDPRAVEVQLEVYAAEGLWEYVHGRKVLVGETPVYGYSFVPPTPFRFKDWEKYDVSRFVDPGCVSPEEGHRSVPVAEQVIRHATIKQDLERMTAGQNLERAVFLFHSPPYRTNLDRANLDGKTIEHVPLDVHVGSIAIRRLIEERQPLLTLHGHVHESAALTGSWRDRIGRTTCLGAAHDGPELALVSFDLGDLSGASRRLV